MPYTIVLHDDDGAAYWITRLGDTDNYSYNLVDATLFKSKSAARALIVTLELGDDHDIVEVGGEHS